MNPKEEKECRKAFETVHQAVLSFKTYEKYRGWRLCWDYILTHKKKELDEMLDEMYNDIEQEKFMEKSGGLK
jgi:hypothetical protein